MQNKKNTTYFALLRLLFFFALEWTKKSFKASFETYILEGLICIGGHGTLQKYRGTGTRYFAKISTVVPAILNQKYRGTFAVLIKQN